MSIALVKISSVEDKLIPLELACLQAYLKENSKLSKKMFKLILS